MKKLFLIPVLLLFTGCASAGLNAACGHINGTNLSYPYVGGKGDANVYACHMGCMGMSCPKPDYTTLQALTSDYVKATAGAVASMPATITITPSK